MNADEMAAWKRFDRGGSEPYGAPDSARTGVRYASCPVCNRSVPIDEFDANGKRCADHRDSPLSVVGCPECGGESVPGSTVVRHERDCVRCG